MKQPHAHDKESTRFVGLLKRLRLAGSDESPPFERFRVTPAQIAVLEVLAEQPGCTLKELARALGLSSPTVSVALWRLEAAGLVNREPRDDDARALSIEPTKDALGLLSELARFREEKSRSLLSVLKPEEAHVFLDLLDKLLGAALARDPDDEGMEEGK